MKKAKTVLSHHLAALYACRRGNVAIELAFLTPVLIAMILGAVEFGRLGFEQTRLTSAARAGVQYGVQDFSTSGDITGIVNAVRNDAGDTLNALTVGAQQVCRCPGGGASVPCNSSCADGEFAPLFVEVDVSRTMDLWFSFPGVPDSVLLDATSSIRLR